MHIFTTKPRTIGYALRDDRVVLAEAPLGEGGNPLRLAAMALPSLAHGETFASPSGVAWLEALSEVTRTLLRAMGGKARGIIALPDSRTAYRHLHMARLPDAEMEQGVRWQMARELSAPVDSLRVDYLDLGETKVNGRVMREVLAVAATISDLQACCGAVQRAGLRVTGVDGNRLAALRSLNDQIDTNSSILFVELGRGDSWLHVVVGGVPRFSRKLDIGGTLLTHAAPGADAVVLGEIADTILREAMLCIHTQEDASAALLALSHGVLLWADPRSAELTATLSESMGIEFLTPLPPASFSWASEPSAADTLAALVATGLASHSTDQLVRAAA